MTQQPSNPEQSVDPFDAITLEFIDCLRRGEQPNAEQFARLHPQFAEKIVELFPTIAAMEKLRDIKDESHDQQHSGIKLERLGDLRIIREVGRGGMGIVYEAEQESLARRVAVKVLPTQMLLDPKQLARFKRESRNAAKLHHTNIVPILGVGEHEGYHYYVMQLIEGVGLDEVTQMLVNLTETSDGQSPLTAPAFSPTVIVSDESTHDALRVEAPRDSRHASATENFEFDSQSSMTLRGLLDPIEVANLGTQAASALQFAHEQGVLHRDIKPANLILDSSGVLWIADFGLSKGLEGEAVTQTGDMLGTVRYMAPEQFLGEADARSDIYSLGLTIYELLTRHPAHDDQLRRKAFVTGEVSVAPTAPSQLDAKIPRDLETVVLKAIAAEPADRYQTAAELADDLRCIVEDRPIQARRANRFSLLWRWCRRNRALAASMSVAALAIIMVAITSTLKYYSTKELNERVTGLLNDERVLRLKAETTSAIAWDALDEIFAGLAPRRVEAGGFSSTDGDSGLSLGPSLSAESAELLQKLLTYYNRLSDEGDTAIEYQQRIAEAHRRIGDIYQRLGKYELAQAGYERSVSIFQQVSSSAERSAQSAEVRIAIAAMTNELANVQRSLNDRDSELAFRADGIEQLADVMQNDVRDHGPAIYELARTLYFHGRIERPTSGKPLQRGGMKQRLQWPTDHELPAAADPEIWSIGLDGPRALRASIQLLERAGDSPEIRYLLARCYQDTANRGRGQTDPEAAAKARETFLQLVDEFPDVTDYRFALCLTWAASDPGRTNRSPAEFETLSTQFQQAVHHSAELVRRHPNEPAYHLLHGQLTVKLANVLSRARHPTESREAFESAMRIHNNLATSFPDSLPCLIAQAHSKVEFARQLSRFGETERARSLIEESIQLLEQLQQNGAPERLVDKPLQDATRQLKFISTR